MPHQLRLPVGPRRLQWDAHGRLMGVTLPDGKLAASFRYSHRGERIATAHEGVRQHFLHDEQRRVVAELDSQGKVRRRIVYLGDLPLAFIEQAQAVPVSTEPSAWQVLRRAWRDWADGGERIVWLHSNHLGAVEAASDDRAQLLWQGQYDGHGSLRQQQGRLEQPLRLPGQWFDAATGLHHSDQRWYDPERGEYLSPDPLGTPDGPNAYSYVRANPLRYVDPEGLLLFAFDGAGNADHAGDLAKLGNGPSNVMKFRDLYEDGARHYVTGVGTRHRDAKYGDIAYGFGNTSIWDMGFNKTRPVRIQRMIQYLNDEADAEGDDEKALDIDITGFSRGAAQARHFANLIVAATKGGCYQYKVMVDGKEETRCQKLNFRFLGLYDSVLSTNYSGTSYQLGIPEVFAHVSHAVALNEYRGKTRRSLAGSLGSFPLESIRDEMTTPVLPVGKTRTEMGFLGSHADIGGGFAGDNQLAKVALAWMLEQAKAAGVKMGALSGANAEVDPKPVLHDKSDNQLCMSGPGCSEDRQVRFQGGDKSKQRDMPFSTGMHAG